MPDARKSDVRQERPITRPVEAGTQVRALTDFDTQLMLQARAGDREAAAALIRRNSTRIARYLQRLLRGRGPVEDLTQDVFLRVLQNADHYHPTAKVTTWLYRIATNTALNYMKRPDVRRPASEPRDGDLDLPARGAEMPDRAVNREEIRHRVAQCVNALPTNQRIALTLFQYEDCSYEQIAEVLDVSVEAVRSLLMRARTTLRGQLREVL